MKIVTICEKVMHRKCYWPQATLEFLRLNKQFSKHILLQMHRKKRIAAFYQNVFQLGANAIQLEHWKGPEHFNCGQHSQHSRILSHLLQLSSSRVHSDNNSLYLQVQKQYEAICGCCCCQCYQLGRAVGPMRWHFNVTKRVQDREHFGFFTNKRKCIWWIE